MAPRFKHSNETIMDKLKELDINEDVDADDAAVGQAPAPVEEDDEEEEDPLDAVDGGIDDEDSFETPSLPKSNLRDALFADSQKRPVGRPKKVVQQPSAPIGYAAPAPIPQAVSEITYEPMHSVAVPGPRIAGKVPKAGSVQAATARGMGRLAAKMPGAEQCVVYKRNDKQQLALIGRYSLKDLTGFNNIDMFIFDMIKPKYGAGEYQVMGVDPMGREIVAGNVLIEEPPSQSQDNSMVDLLKTMLERQDKQQKEAAAVNQPVAPINPISMLKDVHELQKTMATPALPKEDGTIAAVIAAQGQQMQAMMQMMSQQNQQTTQLLIAAMTPKEDPMMKMLLAKLVEEKSSSGMQGLSLPPPPPPVDSMTGLKDLATLFMPLIAAYLKKGDGDDTKDLLKALIAQKESEALKPKEVIELMNSMQQTNKGSDDFRKSVENLGMMMQISKNLNSGNEGSSSAGFFDALAALFSNRDFAGSIAQAVRAKAETAQKKEVINAETHLLAKKGELMEKIQRNRAQPPAAVIRPAVPAQGPIQHQNVVPMQRPVAVPQQQAAAQQPQRPAFRLPPLPGGTGEHVKGLAESKDDGELLGKTVQMLLYFAEFPEWRPMADMLLGTIQQGEKDKAINIVRNVFTGFATMGVMTEQLAVRVITSFIANFDVIQAQIGEMDLGGEPADPVESVLEETALDESDEGEEDDEEEDDGEGEEENEEDEVDEEKPAAG